MCYKMTSCRGVRSDERSTRKVKRPRVTDLVRGRVPRKGYTIDACAPGNRSTVALRGQARTKKGPAATATATATAPSVPLRPRSRLDPAPLDPPLPLPVGVRAAPIAAELVMVMVVTLPATVLVTTEAAGALDEKETEDAVTAVGRLVVELKEPFPPLPLPVAAMVVGMGKVMLERIAGPGMVGKLEGSKGVPEGEPPPPRDPSPGALRDGEPDAGGPVEVPG